MHWFSSSGRSCEDKGWYRRPKRQSIGMKTLDFVEIQPASFEFLLPYMVPQAPPGVIHKHRNRKEKFLSTVRCGTDNTHPMSPKHNRLMMDFPLCFFGFGFCTMYNSVCRLCDKPVIAHKKS